MWNSLHWVPVSTSSLTMSTQLQREYCFASKSLTAMLKGCCNKHPLMTKSFFCILILSVVRLKTSMNGLSYTLLAFIDKYCVLTNQWTWLYEALLEVSMTKIALWIRVCGDDWAAESAIKASDMCEFIKWRVHWRPYRPVVCTRLRLILKHSIGESVFYNRFMNINEQIAFTSDQGHCSVWPWPSMLFLRAL